MREAGGHVIAPYLVFMPQKAKWLIWKKRVPQTSNLDEYREIASVWKELCAFLGNSLRRSSSSEKPWHQRT